MFTYEIFKRFNYIYILFFASCQDYFTNVATSPFPIAGER